MLRAGMGKTCVTVSLVLARPYSPPEKKAKAQAAAGSSSSSTEKVYKMTVIVAPSTLVQQWLDEIAKVCDL